MITIFILLVTLIVLDIAALKWGADSRDALNNSDGELKWQSGSVIP